MRSSALRRNPNPVEQFDHGILLVRSKKVMLDADLAALYGIETRELSQGNATGTVSRQISCSS